MLDDSLRVLVVDDHADSAEVIAVIMRLLGHDVRRATSGRAALVVIESFDPELILLDLGLPDVSGLDIARVVRARTDRSQPFLVAVTGWSSRSDEARASGFDRFLLKPPDIAELRALATDARTHRAA